MNKNCQVDVHSNYIMENKQGLMLNEENWELNQ